MEIEGTHLQNSGDLKFEWEWEDSGMTLITGLNNWEVLSDDINGTKGGAGKCELCAVTLKPIITSRRCTHRL